MKKTIATSIEQSQRLIACGVDSKTADMYWRDTLTNKYLEVLDFPWKDSLRNLNHSPAWSTSRLLELLPTPIYSENRRQFSLCLKPIPNGKAWICEYFGHGTCLYQTNGETVIEAVVRMIENLTKEGYKLNQIEI